MSENILEVKGLTKDYGDFVLDKLTFTVPKGVIMGLIGENGAGMSMIISLTTCDEQWKWGKYAVSLPVSKKQIVCSRYACAGILSLIGFVVALIVNSASYILFPQYAYGFYLFMSCASFALTLLFLAFVLPSNYSLGVNAGFATMFILIILLVVLGLWTKATNNSIMWFVVENFEVSIAIAGVSVVAICGLSFVLSNLFFRKKYI